VKFIFEHLFASLLKHYETKGVHIIRYKYATILPIHKKGDEFIMSNYKPISLLLSCPKILETIMFNRLCQYEHTNKILAPEQFGFRKESNIEKVTFSLTDSVLFSLNLQQQIGGIFMIYPRLLIV
jgi:hypothetical protein